MDLNTAQEIIMMIDEGIDNLNRLLYSEEGCNVSEDYIEGGMHQLSALKDKVLIRIGEDILKTEP